MPDALQPLVEAIRFTRGLFLTVTGAGISLASGIPTFRGTDPGAVWKHDVTELGTVRYFSEEPEGSWSWYLRRFESLTGAQPNPGHTALVEIERWRAQQGEPFLLVTQNIDGLHRRAGSEALVEVHGSAERVRCSSHNCQFGAPSGSLARASIDLTAFLAEPTRDRVPRCPACGEWLRQHVLWFDELYNSHADYQWKRVLEASRSCALLLFVGTSLSVGVTDQLLSAARERRVPVFNIDPAGEDLRGVHLVRAPSESVLPTLADRLRG